MLDSTHCTCTVSLSVSIATRSPLLTFPRYIKVREYMLLKPLNISANQ